MGEERRETGALIWENRDNPRSNSNPFFLLGGGFDMPA